MVDRVQIKETVYMKVDGQWEIVLPGTVIDVPSATALSSNHVSAVQKGVGTLSATGQAAFVSNKRTR